MSRLTLMNAELLTRDEEEEELVVRRDPGSQQVRGRGGWGGVKPALKCSAGPGGLGGTCVNRSLAVSIRPPTSAKWLSLHNCCRFAPPATASALPRQWRGDERSPRPVFPSPLLAAGTVPRGSSGQTVGSRLHSVLEQN